MREIVSQQSDVPGDVPAEVDQTWRSNPKWAGGQIVDDPRSGQAVMWAFVAIWNACVWPVAILILVRNDLSKQPVALSILLLPLAGLLVAYGAFRQTLRHRRFGVSVLKLDSMPASPGTDVAGTITTPSSFNDAAVQLHLFCTHRRITGSGEHQRTHESTLWEDEQEVRSKTAMGKSGTSITFRFRLPANVPVSDIANSYDQRLWRISAKSQLPGMEYRAKFEIPVYRIATSSGAMEEESLEPLRPLAESTHAKPAEPGITTTKRIDGGWDIHFAAGRNKGAAGIVALIGFIFAGAAVGLGYFAHSYLFGAILGLIALAMAVGLWQMLLAQTQVTVSRGTIKVRKWSPVHGSTREWSADQIENITFKITSQVGDKPYYSIRIHLKDGDAKSAGSGISSKRDTRWIVDRMRESLRLSVTSDAEEISNR